MVYLAEEDTRGTKHLSLDEARAIALAYVRQHWAHFDSTAVLQREERFEDPPALPAEERRVPWCTFRWVVKEGQIEVGFAMVRVNPTTGVVFDYGQGYYSAKGLERARLTAGQAKRLAPGAFPADLRKAYTLWGEPYLHTRWFKGGPRLVWVVTFKETGSVAGMPPRGLPGEVEIDAVTGGVVSCGAAA